MRLLQCCISWTHCESQNPLWIQEHQCYIVNPRTHREPRNLLWIQTPLWILVRSHEAACWSWWGLAQRLISLDWRKWQQTDRNLLLAPLQQWWLLHLISKIRTWKLGRVGQRSSKCLQRPLPGGANCSAARMSALLFLVFSTTCGN